MVQIFLNSFVWMCEFSQTVDTFLCPFFFFLLGNLLYAFPPWAVVKLTYELLKPNLPDLCRGPDLPFPGPMPP